MRRALLTASAPPAVALPAIGDAFMGGYFAGVINTTQRYALIVSPKSLEHASQAYKTTNTAGPTGVQTRWDGLAATEVMQAASATAYPAANYCYGLTYPTDDASRWYLPALDEMELVFRNLKATTENNITGTRAGGTYPGGTLTYGVNPSSDPTGGAYTATAPAQTTVPAFQDGGSQDLGDAGSAIFYRTATEESSFAAWVLQASGISGAGPGYIYYPPKGNYLRVRPVRRLVL